MQLRNHKATASRSSFGLSAVMLALIALTSGAARAQQIEEPTLTCSQGEALLEEYGGTLAVFGTGTGLPDQINSSVNLSVDMSSVEATVWTSVGHPELGCLIGDGADADDGNPACDQSDQANEELYIDAFGGSTFILDHGTDQWMAFGGNDISYGPQSAGAYPVIFRHSNQSLNETPESVTYKAIICGVPIGWDKSSLEFSGSTTVAGGMVSAEICNVGDKDMLFPSGWELYFASQGNPKNGAVIDSGMFGPLDSGECTTLTAPDQGLVGNFKFKADQAAGHPGQGELWSD